MAINMILTEDMFKFGIHACVEDSWRNGEFEMTVEEVKKIIKRHIAELNASIDAQEQRIREVYDAGIHTNVDPYRDTIRKSEQQRFVLTYLLDEISE
jgi:hypothetical protein